MNSAATRLEISGRRCTDVAENEFSRTRWMLHGPSKRAIESEFSATC